MSLTDSHQENITNVLNDFFEDTDKGWIHKRINVEIHGYKENIVARNKRNGKLGGRPKKTQEKPKDKPVVTHSDKFNFKKEILLLGVNESTLNDWLVVRKKKKASNTKTALNGLLKEINNSGLTHQQCIEIAATNSWAGFKVAWINKPNTNLDGIDFDSTGWNK